MFLRVPSRPCLLAATLVRKGGSASEGTLATLLFAGQPCRSSPSAVTPPKSKVGTILRVPWRPCPWPSILGNLTLSAPFDPGHHPGHQGAKFDQIGNQMDFQGAQMRSLGVQSESLEGLQSDNSRSPHWPGKGERAYSPKVAENGPPWHQI